MTNRDDYIKRIAVAIGKEKGELLERFAESEADDRKRFELGVDSKYGWPEEEYTDFDLEWLDAEDRGKERWDDDEGE